TTSHPTTKPQATSSPPLTVQEGSGTGTAKEEEEEDTVPRDVQEGLPKTGWEDPGSRAVRRSASRRSDGEVGKTVPGRKRLGERRSASMPTYTGRGNGDEGGGGGTEMVDIAGKEV
ncbi:MAG: hypothetical protein L6R39_006754, partial [Caloplaca ligustica]